MNDTINQVGASAPALKVTTSAVTKLFIEGAENLDPITVFLEDFEPKRGKITVSCWGKSWTAYWGGMWDGMKVGEFFTQLNAQYIIGYFAPQLRSSKFSGEALAAKARREVLRLRRARDLDEGEARELYDDAEDLENAESVDYLWGGYSELMARLFGDEWWHAADDATEPNPDYDYLCRIIKAVQQALAAAPAAPAVQEPVAYCDERTLQTLRSGTAFSVGVEPASRRTDGNDIALYATPPAHPDAALVEALEHARQFIRNGVDLGFIRMPDADAPDPAHETLPRIDAALSTYRAARAALVVELPEPSPHIRYMDHRGAVETIMAQVRDALERQGVKVKP